MRDLGHGRPDAFFSVVSDGKEAASLDAPIMLDSVWRTDDSGVLVQGNHYPDSPYKFILDAGYPGAQGRMEKNSARVSRLQEQLKRSLLENKGGVKISDLMAFITSSPVRNATTTLACVMDPLEGRILWSAAYKRS